MLELSHSAVTVASPADLAITIPSESTVATVGLSILQKINPAVAASPVSPLPSINLYLIAFVFASSSSSRDSSTVLVFPSFPTDSSM